MKLDEEDIPLQVREIDQVAAVECDDVEETNTFKSNFYISFSAFLNVADEEIHTLADLLAAEYNSLVGEYCDPQARRDISLVAVDKTRVTSGRRLQ